jgi:hypothetical protein
MNMVRAGVVGHPSEWSFSGYNEIQAPRQRYALIDYEALKELLEFEASLGDVATFLIYLIVTAPAPVASMWHKST